MISSQRRGPFLWILIGFLLFISDVWAQRVIVAIGDSNGASEIGWVNQLKSMRPKDSIFNYSVSGNTIGFDNNQQEKLNTLKNINAYLNDATTKTTTGNIDDIVILLGTNDCKKVFEGRKDEIISNLEKLIISIKKHNSFVSGSTEVYIVTPLPYGPDSQLKEKYQGADLRVQQLLPGFMQVAIDQQCHFIDIYHDMKPQFAGLNIDGVHANDKGSKMIAGSISTFLNKTAKIRWDDETQKKWPDEVKTVEIPSTLDGEIQKAYFYKSTSPSPQPLIISLHTWSGDYTQEDPLIHEIMARNWNYIHPDFRGPNKTPKACGSKFAIQDIEDAITFAVANTNTDPQNIHLIGVSGGGYATLFSYMNSTHGIASFSAWVPLSDIESWYYQSVGRKNQYAGHILSATGSFGAELNAVEARSRSPLFMKTPVNIRKDAPLTLYAGVHDGYSGSVPISQSLLFYNKVIKDFGAPDSNLITDQEILDLVSMRYFRELPEEKIGGRQIIFKRSFKNISIVIFEGRHEMLTDVALDLIPINHGN